MSQRDKDRIVIRPTIEEKAKFNSLMDSLQNECNISPKEQSKIIIEGFFQYAEHLLSSYVNHTHTNSHSLTKQRKDAVFNIIELIKEKGYMFFMESYSSLILSNECFFDVKTRSKANYFQGLLQSEELYFLYLPNYSDLSSRTSLVIIHRQSKWWSQLGDLCFKINNPILKVTADNKSDAKLKDDILQRLKRKAEYKSNLDRAEKTMLNAFLYEIGELKDKPMYDQTDLVLQEVIQLRSQLRFEEAQEVFNLEKKHKQNFEIKSDDGLEYLENL